MAKKLIIFILVVAIIICAVIVFAPYRPAVTLTPAMQREFGALKFVPADSSAYSAAFHLTRQCEQVWNSNAVQNLVKLPVVQQLWSSMQGERIFADLLRALETDPLFVQGLPVLKDAFSTEVFVCTGPDLPPFVEGAGRALDRLRLAEMLGNLSASGGAANESAGRPVPEESPDVVHGDDPAAIAVVDAVLAYRAALHVPSAIIGFRLKDRDAAQRFLDTWVPKIGPLPVGRIDKRQVNGAQFHVLELSAESIPEPTLSAFRDALLMKGVAAQKVEALLAWVRGQRLVVAAGVLGDYLLVSVGKDLAFLRAWGGRQTLAVSPQLEPLRKHFRPGLVSIQFSSAELARALAWNPARVKDMLETAAQFAPDDRTPQSLRTRLKADAARLADDLAPLLESPQDSVAFAVENHGLESWEFGVDPGGSLDCTKPLSVLGHGGRRPILLAASRARPDTLAWPLVEKWTPVFVDYFERLALPSLGPRERSVYNHVMARVRPCAASVNDALKSHILPAINGTQSAWVLDGGGQVTEVPNLHLSTAVPVPRIAAIVELNDPVQFTQGVGKCAGAIRLLIDGLKADFPNEIPAGLTLPPPESAPVAGGQLYFYRLPWPLGDDVMPCALIRGNLLVLSTSRTLAAEAVEPQPAAKSDVVSLDGPSGSTCVVNGPAAWDYLRRLADSVYANLDADGAFSRRERSTAMAVKMHVDALWRSLGAFRGYVSAVTLIDGRPVRHSHLQVEDIAP